MLNFLHSPWRWWAVLGAGLLLVLTIAFWPRGGPNSKPEVVWGAHGVQDGDFHKPRAAAIDRDDRLYIVDFTARVQVFDRDGTLLHPPWRPPDWGNGRPSGMSIDREGRLLLSDSHYQCLRIYSPEGKELRSIQLPYGSDPGQVSYISDTVQDDEGYFYLAEFGLNQRITKLDANGKFVTAWGSPGPEPGQFNRIRALAIGPTDQLLYVADACNHRIQVFTRDGALVRTFGQSGTGPGQLRYPYDLAFNRQGELYVIEHGNHRVQKFTSDGRSLGWWGGPGREPGQMDSPWALAVDSWGRVHVIDTGNHRVQRVNF